MSFNMYEMVISAGPGGPSESPAETDAVVAMANNAINMSLLRMM